MRTSHESARIAKFLQHQLVAGGHYGKNEEPAQISDFCPWLETPITLETAQREWN